MYIFPLISTAVSLVFAVMLGRQYAAKRRPHQLAWAAAMVMYGIASGAEAVGQMSGWNDPLLIKAYYIFGAVMVVGYLALGTLYIQDPKVARWLVLISGLLTAVLVVMITLGSEEYGAVERTMGAAVFAVIIAQIIILAFVGRPKISTVWLVNLLVATAAGLILTTLASVDSVALANLVREGAVPYKAIDRSVFLRGTVVTFNIMGGTVLVLGAIYSGYTLLRKNIMREVAVGTLLIGIGAFFPFSSGILEGYFEAVAQAIKSIFLTIGIVIMFFGFLQTGRPSAPAAAEPKPEIKTEVETPA